MNFKCSAVSGRGSKKKKAQKRKCSKNLSQRTMPEQYRAVKGKNYVFCIVCSFLLILARLCQRLREMDEDERGLRAAAGVRQQRRHGPPLSTHLSPPLLLLCMLFRLCAKEKETGNSNTLLMQKLCQQATRAVRCRHVQVVSALAQPTSTTAGSA